ncbi:hypothetical protein Ahy_B03g062640 [Arachis hypogaea]|uniref:Uncharacterized protein n=1 Tax=Arachis hypogaea TaxID=3818 RepID=A0A444ZUZ8_ARAHY|nr:hypothetical protein Ahy_B03g062640 [Arachis hypogaea]
MVTIRAQFNLFLLKTLIHPHSSPSRSPFPNLNALSKLIKLETQTAAPNSRNRKGREERDSQEEGEGRVRTAPAGVTAAAPSCRAEKREVRAKEGEGGEGRAVAAAVWSVHELLSEPRNEEAVARRSVVLLPLSGLSSSSPIPFISAIVDEPSRRRSGLRVRERFAIAERLGLEGASVVISSCKQVLFPFFSSLPPINYIHYSISLFLQQNVEEAAGKLRSKGIECGNIDVIVSNAAANPSVDPILQTKDSVLDKLHLPCKALVAEMPPNTRVNYIAPGFVPTNFALFITSYQSLSYCSRFWFFNFHHYLITFKLSCTQDNFGRLHDRSKETPKVMKQLSSLFPNRVTIQLPQDETLLSDWKQQQEHDVEIMKAQSNVVSIRTLWQKQNNEASKGKVFGIDSKIVSTCVDNGWQAVENAESKKPSRPCPPPSPAWSPTNTGPQRRRCPRSSALQLLPPSSPPNPDPPSSPPYPVTQQVLIGSSSSLASQHSTSILPCIFGFEVRFLDSSSSIFVLGLKFDSILG